MSRRKRLAAALATALSTPLFLLPAPAFADPFFRIAAAHLARQDAAGGGGAPAAKAAPPADTAPTATIADVAGTPTKVALPDLLQTTVRQSPALATARIDIEVAQAAIEQTYGIEDWLLGAQVKGQWTEISQERSDGDALSPVPRRQLSLDGTVDLTRALSTGGTFGVHAATGVGRRTANIVTRVKPGETAEDPITYDYGDRAFDTYSDSLSASLTQPLLRGRGSRIARDAQAQARISRDAVVLDQRRVAIAQVRAVVQAYWELAYSLRDLEIRRSSLDLARERLRLTQAGINGGRVAPSEALAVEQVIATRQEEILGSELNVLNQSIALRRAAGLEIAPGQLALTTETEISVQPKTWDLPALFAAAQSSSPELAVLATREKGASIEVEVADNGRLPGLDAALSVGTGASDNTAIDALKATAQFKGVTVVGSLTYQQALGHTTASGRVRQARAERERVRINAVDVSRQIGEAIAEAVALVRSAEQRVQLGVTAVKLAEQNIGVEQSRFNLGKSTNFDVLLRQDELKAAQLRQARATIDWYKAQAAIQSLTGDILPTYGISLAEK